MTETLLLSRLAVPNQRFPSFFGGGFGSFGGQTNNQAAQAISQGSFFPGGINQAQAGEA
jgi:hypothetical protein